MINLLHTTLHRPEHGWDPVPSSHVAAYAAHATESFDQNLVPMLVVRMGSLADKRVLDLGGGPGNYSVEFWRHGAKVFWHDVSRRYMDLAQENAKKAGAKIEFSLGYLEQAQSCFQGKFDLVFCRVCWHYCVDDQHFARMLYSLIKPGGAGYVECNTPEFANPRGVRKVQYFLNNHLWLKLGHPYPPHGRIEQLFRRFPISRIDVDYSSIDVDRIFFLKPNMP
jgi:SAM-dependent methyltransferase